MRPLPHASTPDRTGRRRLSVGVSASILCLATLAGCTEQEPAPGPVTTETQATATETTTQTTHLIGTDDAVVGALDGDGFSVLVPAGALELEAEVAVSRGADLPDDSSFAALSPPLALDLSGDQSRFDQPVQVSISFDPADITEPGEVCAAYYHKDYGWELFAPDQVDLEKGIMTFATYHFSAYAAAQVNDDTRIEMYAKQSAVEQHVRTQAGKASQKQIEEMVKTVMQEGMGVTDSTLIGVITRAVVEEVPYGKIGLALYDMKADDFVNAVVVEIANQAIKKSGAMTEAGVSAGGIAALSGAAGAASMGDDQRALEILTEELVGQVIDETGMDVLSNLKLLGKVAVRAVDHTVNKVWKPTEMEKAFRVYENGAEGGWWGYSVDAGDFEQLSSHMRGLSAKIRYDYVQSYCDARGLDPGDLTEDEWNAIGNEGIEHVKRQFDERIARKADIEKIQADTLDLMELFREKGLLERSYSNPMYSGHDDLEMLMNRLGNMVETVKRDAGRFELVDATDYDVADPKDRGGLLPRQWVAELIFEWYSNGQEAYQAKLVELGLVDPHPALAELAGDWSGTWLLTAWEIPPQEGLSVSAPPESGEMTLTITVDAGGGTVQMMDTSAPLTYEGGNISFVLSIPIVMLEKNVGTGTIAVTGAVTEGDGGLYITGTYRAEWGLPGWWGEYTWEAHKAG